jgi:hypothetical protein
LGMILGPFAYRNGRRAEAPHRAVWYTLSFHPERKKVPVNWSIEL